MIEKHTEKTPTVIGKEKSRTDNRRAGGPVSVNLLPAVFVLLMATPLFLVDLIIWFVVDFLIYTVLGGIASFLSAIVNLFRRTEHRTTDAPKIHVYVPARNAGTDYWPGEHPETRPGRRRKRTKKDPFDGLPIGGNFR